jgi:hypothetical protein
MYDDSSDDSSETNNDSSETNNDSSETNNDSSETNNNNTTTRAAISNDLMEIRRDQSAADSSETARVMNDGRARIQPDRATDDDHQVGDDMIGETSITTASRKVSSDAPNTELGGRVPVNCSSNEKGRSTSPEGNTSTARDVQPGAHSAPGRAFGAPVRRIVARYSSRLLMRRESLTNQNDDNIVSAKVVDEQELEAEYRDRILGDIFDASEVLPVQESEPPTFWERHKISVVLCIVMTTVVLVLVLLLTLNEAPSAETQLPPTLPPTLQGIHERGYIRCRVSDRAVDIGEGYSIDLVSTL